jgi:hypothetical protein
MAVLPTDSKCSHTSMYARIHDFSAAPGLGFQHKKIKILGHASDLVLGDEAQKIIAVIVF